MKPKLITTALAAALLAPGALFAQTTATTTPVGYVTLPAVPANTDVSVSIPLERPTTFSGVVASVQDSTITITGANFGSLSEAATPNLVKFGSGARNGLTALIVANTSTTLTISVPAGDNLTGVVAGDRISILPAWTPATLFSVAPPAGTQILAFSGTSPGVNIGFDVIYEYDGANWIDTGTFDAADNNVLFQGEGFTVRTSADTGLPATTIAGQVPTANSRIILNNISPGDGQDIVIGYVGAVGEVIGTSGLGNVVSAGDQILAVDNTAEGINKGFSTILEFDGAAWVDTGSFDDVTNTFKFEPGVGYTLRRSSASPAGDLIWTDLPNYVTGQ